MILAFVLGPILENGLRQSLLMSAGSPLIFIERPISGSLIAILVLFILVQAAIRLAWKKPGATAGR
jgi:putative tricarboxylic transport membrane protein